MVKRIAGQEGKKSLSLYLFFVNNINNNKAAGRRVPRKARTPKQSTMFV